MPAGGRVGLEPTPARIEAVPPNPRSPSIPLPFTQDLRHLITGHVGQSVFISPYWFLVYNY
jgi:hypothetical protein